MINHAQYLSEDFTLYVHSIKVGQYNNYFYARPISSCTYLRVYTVINYYPQAKYIAPPNTCSQVRDVLQQIPKMKY